MECPQERAVELELKMRFGTKTPSSTRSTSARFTTATATASAISAGSRRSSTTCRNWASTRIWLMPFFPSPLRDDGYDIADYYSVHPSYGTLDDFKAFLHAAHRRGIRVIVEMVLNHTSDQHPWFQESRKSRRTIPSATGMSGATPTPSIEDVRIIFVDTELSNWAWDPVSKSYYWHRFFSHQPDLNYRQSGRARRRCGM